MAIDQSRIMEIGQMKNMFVIIIFKSKFAYLILCKTWLMEDGYAYGLQIRKSTTCD